MTTLDENVRAEIKSLRANGDIDHYDGAHKTARGCHVCCEVESKDLVNKLLAAMFTTREIVNACRFINDRREAKGDARLIEMHNVKHHRLKHFNVEKPAQAAYRAIAERRATEANRDFEEGVGTVVTPYGAIETTLAKGYGKLTDEDTTVTVGEMLSAAKLLHEFTSKDQSQQKMADLLFTMDKLINAAQEYIPPDQHSAFLARVRGQQVRAIANEPVITESVRVFTPSTEISEEDEI